MDRMLKKLFCALLAVAMVFTTGAGDLAWVFAGDTSSDTSATSGAFLMVNGDKGTVTGDSRTYTIHYGDRVKFTWGNASDGDTYSYYYKGEEESEDQYKPLGEGRSQLTPGTYDLKAYITDQDNNNTEVSGKLNVEKAKLAAPADPAWSVVSGSSGDRTDLVWSGVKHSETNSTDDISSAVKEYRINVYRDGTSAATYTSTSPSYANISNSLENAGSYTFTVTAIPENTDLYQTSEPAEGKPYKVVEATIQGDSGITSASFGGPEKVFLWPGQKGREISAAVKDDYEFEKWSDGGQGLDFEKAGSSSTTVSIPLNYSGATKVTIQAQTKDKKAPEISSFAPAKKSDDSEYYDRLSAKAADGDSGIAAYSFSRKSSAADVDNWAEVASAPKDAQTFHLDPQEPGKYYFYVKDADGNIAKSKDSIAVTKVTYENVYENGEKTSVSDLFAGDDYPLKKESAFSRPSYDFAGIYSDPELTEEAPGSLTSGDPENGYTFYLKWNKQSVRFSQDLDKTLTAEYTSKGTDLSVKAANSGNVTYQWYKDGKAVEGATGSTLHIKGVEESGEYYVKATLENGESGESTHCNVTIQPKPLVVKAENKKITYEDGAPDYTYEVQPAEGENTGLEEGDELDGSGVSFECGYKQGNPAGDYTIKVSGLTDPDYKIQYQTGTLTVDPMDLSDKVSLSLPDSDHYDYSYDPDHQKTPDVTVDAGDIKLTQGSDYTVSYQNNKAVNGKDDPAPSATVTFKGNYTGSATVTFDITKASFKSEVLVSDLQYRNGAPDPQLSSNASGGKVTFYYKKAGEPDSSYSETAPKNAGTYDVYGKIQGTSNYSEVVTDPVEFKITPVKITIHTASNTWSFDGRQHQDLGYTTTGDFVGSDGFQYVKVTGSIKNTGTEKNTCEYAFKEGVTASNYEVSEDLGDLTIEPRVLPAPSNAKWENGGKASWTGVTRDGLEVSYKLDLYGSEPSGDGASSDADKVKINQDDIVTTGTSYDFSGLIKAYAKDHPGASYTFTIQTIPSGGDNEGNYRKSSVSSEIGPVYTVTLHIKGSAGVSKAVAGQDQQDAILISGESLSLHGEVSDGYTFAQWAISPTGGVTIKDSSKADTIITANDLHQSWKNTTVTAESTDDDPVIGSFSTENSADLKSVRLKFTASDVIGLSGWMITRSSEKPSADDEGWQTVPNQATSYEGYSDVTEKGTYYLYVKDSSGNVVSSKALSVYKVTLEPGEGSGDAITILKSENSTVNLPANSFTKDGYAFQNWKGTTGIYTDGGAYSGNSDDTLTAQWTNEIFQYTVKYYEMGTDGKYPSEPAEEKTYSALANTTVKYDDSAISLRKEGFSIASDNNGAAQKITLHENGDVLNVYYARNKYQITYKYKPAGQSDYKIKDVVTKYYGDDISQAFSESTKPSEDGYSFNGWILSDTGDGSDSTMPARDITAVGSFAPKETTYKVVYYKQDLKDGDGTGETAKVSDQYSLDDALTVINTCKHGQEVDLSSGDARAIKGFTFQGYSVSYGGPAGASKPSDLKDSVSAIASAKTGDQMVINCYYSRNTYDLRLQVLENSSDKDTTLYENNWKIPFGAAIDPEYYSGYNKSQWGDKASSGAALLDYTGWSTGSAASSMPAGDVTVTKRYSTDYKIPYNVEVYLEDDSDSSVPSFTKASTFQYYGSEGQTVSVGPDSSSTVDYNDSSEGFSKFIPYFTYYQMDADNSGNKLSTKLTADGSSSDNTLKIYFQRKKMPVTINYYYKNSDHPDGKALATVTKEVKWGSNHKYDPEALAYFNGTPAFSSENYSAEFKDDSMKGYNFRENGYVASYNSYYVLDDQEHSSAYEYNTVDSLKSDQKVITGNRGNVINVYYVKNEPPKMYYLNVKLKTSNVTGHSAASDLPLTYSYGGTDYRVRVASDAYFYKNVTFSADGDFSAYPGLANSITGNNKYVYDTSESNLKDGFQKVTINGYTCYLQKSSDGGDSWLYVADPENRFFRGHAVTYSFPEDAPGYQVVKDFVDQHKAQGETGGHSSDMDSAAGRLAVWSRSYGLSTTYGDSDDLTVILYYKDPVYLLYSYGGATCYQHPYSPGDTVKEIGCPHLERNDTGYTTNWYKDAGLTERAEAPFTIQQTTTLYGNHEHQIYENKEYAYYQLSAPVVQNGTSYDYITEKDLTAFGSDITEKTKDVEQTVATDTGNVTKTVKEKEYYYKGQLVMKMLPVYSRSYETLSMDTDAFSQAGFRFDKSNSANSTSSYLTGQGAELRSYYARDQHQLEIQRQNKTADETKETVFGQELKLSKPSRDGYAFGGWKLYHKIADSQGEEQWTLLDDSEAGKILTTTDAAAVLTMPDEDIRAVAQWTPVSFPQQIFHYYQGVDGSYQEEKVRELAAMDGTPHQISVDGKTIEGKEYKNSSGQVIALSAGSSSTGDLTVFYDPGSLQDPYTLRSVNRIGAVEKLQPKSEDEISLRDHIQSCDGYTFSQAVMESGSNFRTMTSADDKVTAEYGMDLSCYYQLIRNIQIRAGIAVSNSQYTGKEGSVSGAGAHYYGEAVSLAADPAEGYDFAGWYKAADVLQDYDPQEDLGHTLKDDISGVTPMSADKSIRWTAAESGDYIAVMKAREAATPSVTINGISILSYGYGDDTANVLKAEVTFPDGTDSANKVSAYQWYCNGQAIEGADSANYRVETGKDAGVYKYTCAVTVTRYDNGKQATVTSGEHDVTVSPAEITTEASVKNYDGDYDGLPHSANIKVTNVKDPSMYQIYYSDKELTKDDYTSGSTTIPEYTDVNVVDGKRQPYTVYYYIRSKNSNYGDTSGSATVNIHPVQLTLGETDTTFEKTYDGSAEVSGSASDSSTQLGNLAQGGSYKINGILPAETGTAHIIDCRASFDHPDVDTASSVTLSDIKLMYKDGSGDYKHDNNYVFSDSYSISMPASIRPYVITLKWTGADDLVYDGTEKIPAAAIEDQDRIPQGDALALKIQGGQINAGSYSAAANIVLKNSDDKDVNLDNYSIDNGSKPFQIKKRPVTVRPSDETLEYDGKPHTLTKFTVDEATPLAQGHHFTCDDDKSYTAAGKYTLSGKNTRILDGSGASVTSNYDITEGTGTLTIGKKQVTVSGIKAENKVYDGNSKAELDLSGAVIEGAAEGEKLSLDPSKVHGEFQQTSAGENIPVKITFEQGAITGADGTDPENYALSDQSQSEATADITKRIVTVKAEDDSSTYGNAAPDKDFKAVFSGFADGEDEGTVQGRDGIAFKVVKKGASADQAQAYSGSTGAGEYNIVPDVSGLSAENYAFQADDSGILTVDRRTVTISGRGSVTKTYDGRRGAVITDDNYTFGNLANGDTLVLKSWDASYDSKDAGDKKTVTVSNCTIDSDNYQLPEKDGQFTLSDCSITKRDLDVTAEDKSITYGDEKSPEFTVKYSGFADGESILSGSDVKGAGTDNVTPVFHCSYDNSKSDSRGAGEYQITPDGLTSDNYDIHYHPGTLTVEKKKLTFKPETRQGSYSYGSRFNTGSEVTYSTSGLAYDDTASAFSGTPEYEISGLGRTSDDLISSPAGEYKITMSMKDFKSDDYYFASADGTLTVTKLSLTVKGIKTSDRVYDGTDEVHRDQIVLPEFNTTNYQGLQQLDVDYANDDSTGLTAENAIDVTGKYKTGKDVQMDPNGKAKAKDVELRLTLGDYLSSRYDLTSNVFDTTSTINRRPLRITADDKTIKFGQDKPAFTASFAPVDQNNAAVEGLVSGEAGKIGSSNVDMDAPDYDPGKNVTSEGGTMTAKYPVIPANFHSTDVNVENYDVTYSNGSLFVEKNQLAAPQPVWDVKGSGSYSGGNENAGRISWKAVDGIHGIGPESYEIALYRDGTLVDGSEHKVSADTLSYNYTDEMTEAGSYTVKVKAIASEKGNRNPTNVMDSAEGISDTLHAAEVTFAFADDSVTAAGKGENISVGGAHSKVVLPGQKDIELKADLKNGTGYQIDSVTCSSDAVSVVNGDQPEKSRSGREYQSAFSMSPDMDQNKCTITLVLKAVPAEAGVTLSVENGSKTGDNIYDIKYGYDVSPVITATPVHTEEYKDYTYHYSWTLYDKVIGQAVGTDSDQYTFPESMKYAVNRYHVGVTVTAIRKDNGQSVKVSTGREKGVTINIQKGSYAPEIRDYSGWVYGEKRIVPSAEKNITELREDPAVTFQFRKHGDAGSAATTEIPKDAGQYDIRAIIGETGDYDEITTVWETFTIKKGKLAVPSGLKSMGTDEENRANYGRISWNAVPPVKENGGNGDSAGETDILYRVVLQKKDAASGEWTDIKTYPETSNTSLDILEDVQGGGEYRFKVSAVTEKETANCDNSNEAVSDVFRTGGRITVSGSGTSDAAGTSYTQMYDRDGAVLTAEGGKDGETAYQWYRNGKKLEGAVDKTLNVRNVSESGYYTCEMTTAGSVTSTPFIKISVTRRPVTIKADDKLAYYGSSRDRNGDLVGTLTYTDSGKYKIASLEDEKALGIVETARDGNGKAVTIGSGTSSGAYGVVLDYDRDGKTAQNYDVTLTGGSYSISPMPAGDLMARISGTRGNNGWFVSDVDVTAPEGYSISREQDGAYSGSITITSEGEDPISYYLRRDEDGAKTEKIGVAYDPELRSSITGVNVDKTSATGSIKIKNSTFRSLLEHITFGLFFKDTVQAQITSADDISGMASTKYYKSEGQIDPSVLASDKWTEGSTVSLAPNEKAVVYARLEDKAGHVTYLSSGGLVMYTDGSQDTREITFTRTSPDDAEAVVDANGNTIRDISVDGKPLRPEDYRVTYDADGRKADIELLNGYLKDLAAGDHKAEVTYDPMGVSGTIRTDDQTGEDGSRTAFSDNQLPSTTSFTLKVVKAQPIVEITGDPSGVYNGKAVEAPAYEVRYPHEKTDGDSASLTYYRLAENGNRTKLDGAPVTAGKYVVVATRNEDSDHLAASGEKQFTISRRAVTVQVKADSKTYDGNRKAALHGSIETGVEGQTISVSGLTGTFDDKNAGTDKKVQVDSSNAAAKGSSGTDLANYIIKYPGEISTGEIDPKEITAAYSCDGKTYDGNEKAVVHASVETGIKGETLTLSGLSGRFTTPDAGKDKTVQVDRSGIAVRPGETGTELRNYRILYPGDTTTGTIHRKDISGAAVTLGHVLKDNGEVQTQAVKSVVIQGLNATFDVEGNTASEPGAHVMTITGTGNFKGSVKKTWVILAGDERVDDLGKINVDVNVAPSAPATVMNTSKAGVVEVAADAEDLSSVADGDEMNIWLEVTGIDSTISPETKAALDEKAGSMGMKSGKYVDVSMFKKLNSQKDTTRITSTDSPVSITISIPEDLINRSGNIRRSFGLIRYHEGSVQNIPVVYDAENQTLTFETDKFSEYVITYEDRAVERPSGTAGLSAVGGSGGRSGGPKTGDQGSLALWIFLLAASSAGAAGVAGAETRYRRKREGE
ncbi:YDG domain-containing protein [Mobilibacterium timonense]|uniref:YDG domain-containing protein n=1 Tax=Mobilibacterium timonense TaxID=1871012 RepID=UPI003A95958D